MSLDLDPDRVRHRHRLKIIEEVQRIQRVEMDQGFGIADYDLDDGTILRHAIPIRRPRE
jgi:hypothetical protein